MANSMFSTARELVSHLNTALPVSQARGEELFREFQTSGYIGRQENTGLTISPKLWGGNLAGVLSEVSADAPGRVKVVMISNPVFSDDEFDHWVGVVQTWSAGFSDQTRGAWAREIKLMKHVDDGIPLSALHKQMPVNLLFSYRRSGDFVIVIDPPVPGKRRIFATKNIG